jgi:hypothetical protein
MGFQSIYAWKALPEAGFAKKAIIDSYRSFHERFASGWPHRNATPILPQALRVWNPHDPSLEHAVASAALAASLCAGHAQQLGGESPLAYLMEVKV